MLDESEPDLEFFEESPVTIGSSTQRRTITRRELARAVAASGAGVPRNRAAALVDEVLEEISGALIAGQNVTLCNFGKFVLVEKKERKGRNPRTGDLAVVLPRKVASFRASRHLKSAIRQNNPCQSADP